MTDYFERRFPRTENDSKVGVERVDQGEGLRHRPRVAAGLDPFECRYLRQRSGL